MKTEQEKTEICIRFLTARGFNVQRSMLTKEQVAQTLGVTKQTLSRWTNPNAVGYQKQFPAPYEIGAGNVRWYAEDITKYIATTRRNNEDVLQPEISGLPGQLLPIATEAKGHGRVGAGLQPGLAH